MAKSKITPAHATAVATTNRLGAAALSVNEAALPHEEWVAENPLSKAVRSDFEELEERRRTVNLKRRWRRRAKIIRREEAQKDKLVGEARRATPDRRRGGRYVVSLLVRVRVGDRASRSRAAAARSSWKRERRVPEGRVGCVCLDPKTGWRIPGSEPDYSGNLSTRYWVRGAIFFAADSRQERSSIMGRGGSITEAIFFVHGNLDVRAARRGPGRPRPRAQPVPIMGREGYVSARRFVRRDASRTARH